MQNHRLRVYARSLACALPTLHALPYKPRLRPSRAPLQGLLGLGAWPAIFQALGPCGPGLSPGFQAEPGRENTKSDQFAQQL